MYDERLTWAAAAILHMPTGEFRQSSNELKDVTLGQQQVLVAGVLAGDGGIPGDNLSKTGF